MNEGAGDPAAGTWTRLGELARVQNVARSTRR